MRLLLGILLLAANALAFAGQPPGFSYQAKLTGADGAPLSGNHTLFFELYHAGPPEVKVFSETATIAVEAGIVNHTVGTGENQVPGPLTAAMLAHDGDITLQVSVDTVGNVVLPRTRLASVPFAVHALSADNGSTVGHGILTESPTPPAGFAYSGKTVSTPGVWSRLADIPTSRSSACAAEVNGRIYVFGGYTSAEGYSASTTEYDPVSNTWTAKAPMYTPRERCGAAVVDNIVYVIGGRNGSSNSLTTVEMYNPKGDGWVVMAPLPTGRASFAIAEVDGYVYAIGGYNATVSGAVGSNERFDPIANSWLARAPMPTPRQSTAGAAIGGRIYVVGGATTAFESLDANQVYDPSLNAWANRAPLRGVRSLPVVCAHNGRLYAFNGYTQTALVRGTEEYDPVANLWTAKSSPFETADGAVAVSLNNLIYYGTGYIYESLGPLPGPFSSRFDAFDPGVLFVHVKN
jgi:N-acetylneuraminic acid mutarotase